jgi:drug/metabolite transporter (DMT)-like permease
VRWLGDGMFELRQFFGSLMALVGLALVIAPVFLLDPHAAADGADRAEVAAMVQALGAVAGGVVSLVFAWVLLRRR